MRTTYSVSLPVKPYVLKYVQTVEGSPLNFTSSSMLCMIIRAYMENKNYTGLSQQQLNTAISTRSAVLQILIPVKQMHRIGTTINPDGIILINRFLETCFEKALRKFIVDNIKEGGRYKGFKEAYYAFAEMYNIDMETDITYDGLKQMDFRFRKKSEKKNDIDAMFFSTLVPSL